MRTTADPEEQAKFTTQHLRIVTYNVHSCRGSDGRFRPERVALVVRMMDPTIVALQELGSIGVAEYLAKELQMDLFFVAARASGQESYGNALLTRLPGVVIRAGQLPQLNARTETRAVQWVRFTTEWGNLDVFNTHLGLARQERLIQAEALLGGDWLSNTNLSPYVVLCGDLNARPGSDAYSRLCSRLRDAQIGLRRGLATFPALFPVVRIDHVLTSSTLAVTKVTVPSGLLARVASDHRPLVADLQALPEGRS